MPRLRQVARHETTDPLVLQMYNFLFGDRDPVSDPGTATGAPGDWWTVFARVPEIFDHCVAGFALYQETFHGLIPADSVLDGASQGVSDMRQAVGGRWTFVESPRALTFMSLYALMKYRISLPE